jgi:hypothetical protein
VCANGGEVLPHNFAQLHNVHLLRMVGASDRFNATCPLGYGLSVPVSAANAGHLQHRKKTPSATYKEEQEEFNKHVGETLDRLLRGQLNVLSFYRGSTQFDCPACKDAVESRPCQRF